ncbi:MAG: adenosine kinase [Nitriliruptoraceae bacterium]
MRIAVTGSIATDHLMQFPGRFAENIGGGDLERLSVSFLVDSLEIRRGGVAANIAFGLGQLGQKSLLVGAVGRDFEQDYRSWLDRHGVDTSPVHVSETKHTARFLATTDSVQAQIGSFYAGAMSEARDIELGPIAAAHRGLDLIVVSPNDPEAMLRHTEEARSMGVPFLADPSQQISYMDGPQIRGLVDGAAYLVTNDHEKSLLESKTGWTDEDVLDRVGLRITTLGPKGCVLDRKGEASMFVAATPERRREDPTGVGDAFRAGFLAGLSWDVGLERSAQVGSLLATYVLEHVGTQEYRLNRSEFRDRFADCFGEDAAKDVGAHL